MRIAVKTSEVLDFFANKLQSTARASNSWNFSGFSLFYINWILYSVSRYNPIARWVTNSNGDEALFIVNQISGQANGHVWRLEKAANHVRRIRVPLVMCDNHGEMFLAYKLDAEALLDRLKRSQKPLRIAEMFEQITKEVAEYADFFGVTVPQDLQDVLKVEGELWDKVREKVEAAREAQRKEDLRSLDKHLKSVKAFREGRNNWVVRYYGVTMKDKALNHNILRYNDIQHRIETSGGVQIPYTAAKRFYKTIVRARRDNNLDSLRGQQIMQYKVGSVTTDSIFIGCHTIPWSEIELMADELDWNNPKVLGLDK